MTDDELPGERFERGKRRAGLYGAPVVAALAAWANAGGASPALVGLLVLCILWWLTEALPAAVIALAAAVGTVVLGIAPPKVAFGAFGTPLLFLFVGSFFIAEAMKVHGLGERLCQAVGRRARGRLSFLIAIGMTAFVLSMVMSNSAATAVILPIALSLLPPPTRGERDRYGAALVLVVAWGASVGGLGTPVGTPPNGFGIQELERQGLALGFVDWMTIGVPMGLVMMAGLFVVVAATFGIRPGQPLERPAWQPRPWSAGERAIAIALGVAIAGWLAPTIAQLVAPPDVARWVDVHVTEEVVALVAGGLLFVLPGHRPGEPRRPALTWPEATRIEWGVILLFGGGILLGSLAQKTGLAAQWGTALVDATGATSTWSITALVTATAILLSEATSNTATATMMAPLAGALAAAAGAAPIPPVLGATLGASFGFMMPISTGPNALAYATGRVTVGQMAGTGVVFDVAGFALILGTLRVMCPLFGWA